MSWSLLLACATTGTPPVQAPSPLKTLVATAAGELDSRAISPGPAALSVAMVEALESRNLVPEALASEGYVEAFSSQRTTGLRMRHLSSQAGDAHLLLLVETTPRYDAQVSGRYRWMVDVSITLAPTGDLELAQTNTFAVPVFLSFHHEREDEAVAAAAPVVQRRLGHLLDGYLGGL